MKSLRVFVRGGECCGVDDCCLGFDSTGGAQLFELRAKAYVICSRVTLVAIRNAAPESFEPLLDAIKRATTSDARFISQRSTFLHRSNGSDAYSCRTSRHEVGVWLETRGSCTGDILMERSIRENRVPTMIQ